MEDVTSHLMSHLSLHPTLRTCSSDTILRAISELAVGNTTYTSDTGRSYDFNTATMLNSLLVKALLSTGQLVAGESYDLFSYIAASFLAFLAFDHTSLKVY